jgi:uncharacterized protein with PCYCGC motif
MKKALIILLAVIAIAVITVGIRPATEQNQVVKSAVIVEDESPRTSMPTSAHNHAAMNHEPAHFDTAPPLGALRGTLAPEMFTGNVQIAYRAAKEIPQTLAQLPCYCHCDMSKGHKSLHSCFEDQHGESCGICIGEAVMAYNLERQGFTAEQIREQITQAYGSGSSE